jgi:uncharacterized protein involved in response to NO
MEFEELQQIWDAQNNAPLYVMNEQALYHRILSKKKQARHITHFSELLLILVNASAGCIILGLNLRSQSPNISMYVLSAWTFSVAVIVVIGRIHRGKSESRFDQSISSDLKHAVSVATYQVRLSYFMRWNMLPIAVFTCLGMWEAGKPLWIAALILLFFILVSFASKWEHGLYKNRKRELEILQEKLHTEGIPDR